MEMAKRKSLGQKIFLPFFIIFLYGALGFFLYKHPDQFYVFKKLVNGILGGEMSFHLPVGLSLALGINLLMVLFYYWLGRQLLKRIANHFQIYTHFPYSLQVSLGMLAAYLLFLFPAIFHILNSWIILLVLVGLFVWFFYLWKYPTEKKVKGLIQLEDQKDKVFWGASTLLGVIIFLSFYHALLYPESYWDSLIYYLHYGKMTFLEKGFPVLYSGQVGLGLGANYPHFYHLLSAVPAVFFHSYSDYYGQFLAPFCGLLATFLIYETGLIVFRNRRAAVLSALVFRSIPLVNVYFTYATDYSLVMLYTTALLYVSACFFRSRNRFYLLIAGILTAAFPNINYLGWAFYPVVLLIMGLGWVQTDKTERKKYLIWGGGVAGLAVLLGIPWYLRNIWVTGNPVYAFYPEIFGGKRIDLEVLKSCFHEWYANGMGVPGNTLSQRLLNAPGWFFQIWQVNPFFYALGIPAILAGVLFQFTKEKERAAHYYYWIPLSVCLGGLSYHLFISNLYLYQVLFFLPAMAGLSPYLFYDLKKETAFIRNLIITGVFLGALIPGVSMSLMGPKIMEPGLRAFMNPGMEAVSFYRLKLGEYASLVEYINQTLPSQGVILSHENRYNLFRDDLKIRHLDDWDIIPLYQEKNLQKKYQALYQKGIRYYLYIPNEENHPILKKLEIQRMIQEGFLQPLYIAGDNRLYEFQPLQP